MRTLTSGCAPPPPQFQCCYLRTDLAYKNRLFFRTASALLKHKPINIEIGGRGWTTHDDLLHRLFFFANTGTLLTRFRSNLLIFLVPSPWNPKWKQDRQSAGGSGMDARGSSISVLLARSPCAQKRSKTKKALDATAWMQEAGPAQQLYFCSAKHNRCWDACPCCSLSFVVGASQAEHFYRNSIV